MVAMPEWEQGMMKRLAINKLMPKPMSSSVEGVSLIRGCNMFAELLTADRSGPLQELLASYPHKPYGWTAEKRTSTDVAEYMRSRIARIIDRGGIAKTYCLGGHIAGMCTVSPDEWATRELQTRTFHISHLMALGNAETQWIIKSMLLKELMQGLPRRSVLVAEMPYGDLTSINALERLGFTATQTSLHLARELDDARTDSTEPCPYDIETADLDTIDTALAGVPVEIPEGFLGWDSRLPHGSALRVRNDWLRGYARNHNLLMARDHGRPVGFLAEHLHRDTTRYIGYPVGSIDLVATLPEYRSNGVSGRLVHQSLDGFRSRGARFAELTIHSSDTPAAHAYQSQGFVTIGSTLTLAHWWN